MNNKVILLDRVKRGENREVLELIKNEKGTVLDFRDPSHESKGWTCLHWASSGGHSAVVQSLCSHGANSNIVDANGESPLHLASWRGHDDVVKVLLKYGASKNIVNKDGKKPVDLAMGYAVQDLLVERDAWVNDDDDSD